MNNGNKQIFQKEYKYTINTWKVLNGWAVSKMQNYVGSWTRKAKTHTHTHTQGIKKKATEFLCNN